MIFRFERVEGIEPSSSAWKADIISRYTIPACALRASAGMPAFAIEQSVCDFVYVVILT